VLQLARLRSAACSFRSSVFDFCGVPLDTDRYLTVNQWVPRPDPRGRGTSVALHPRVNGRAARKKAVWPLTEGGTVAKEDRGFASMDRAKQREIASKGGKAAHQKGTAHEWTSEEARDAGRKGGIASHRRRREQIGNPGADDETRSPETAEPSRVMDDGDRFSDEG